MSFRFVRRIEQEDGTQVVRSIMDARNLCISHKGPDEFGDKLKHYSGSGDVMPKDILISVSDRTIDLIKGRFW